MDFFDYVERGGLGVGEEIEQFAKLSIGAAIEVHRHLKPGLPESAYKLALSYELTAREIPHVVEFAFPILYKGQRVGEGRIDILVANCLVLELKAIETITDVHRAQVVGYLQAMNLRL